ncbi:MAG: hypothetical protein IJ723_03460, partial [Ruminococcus sp.]|nr:hypothetical protein [Ruminococcus sp.]
MPAFGKKQKEESINDKMVRLFKEGKTVKQISDELDVKPDVITNVIRRRCGEDSIPETVVRSKNAMPHHDEEPVLKAEAAAEPAPAEEPAPQEETSTEGMSKLERLMLEKEKKRQEEAEKAAEEPAPAPEEPEEVTMDAVSMEGISLDSLGTADPTIPEPVYAAEPEIPAEPEMDGISAEDIPEITADTPIEEHPINEFESGETEAPAEEPDGIYADEPAAEETPAEPAAEEPAPAEA